MCTAQSRCFLLHKHLASTQRPANKMPWRNQRWYGRIANPSKASSTTTTAAKARQKAGHFQRKRKKQTQKAEEATVPAETVSSRANVVVTRPTKHAVGHSRAGVYTSTPELRSGEAKRPVARCIYFVRNGRKAQTNQRLHGVFFFFFCCRARQRRRGNNTNDAKTAHAHTQREIGRETTTAGRRLVQQTSTEATTAAAMPCSSGIRWAPSPFLSYLTRDMRQ